MMCLKECSLHESPDINEGFDRVIDIDDRRRIRRMGRADGFIPNLADLDIGRTQTQEKPLLPYVIEDFISKRGGKFEFDGKRFSDYIYAN